MENTIKRTPKEIIKDQINALYYLAYYEDLRSLESILPDHYTITEIPGKNAIRCKSDLGLRKNGNDDHELWNKVHNEIKENFGDMLIEIDFNTCAFYQDFIIFLKSYNKQNLIK
ncbi:hypothetical protein [Chryseobacterium sp. WX]|uniref:hypothetical protein n=1 Tax=Chryseobacterium sp. WX TaxID=3031803 RepID=UPI00240963C0|nr:hypothetical protein [Chryseobacterium sp. WX]WFB67046.1 hypothetical protein PZ898_20380 [Chryseobacterium sp. WX]